MRSRNASVHPRSSSSESSVNFGSSALIAATVLRRFLTIRSLALPKTRRAIPPNIENPGFWRLAAGFAAAPIEDTPHRRGGTAATSAAKDVITSYSIHYTKLYET